MARLSLLIITLALSAIAALVLLMLPANAEQICKPLKKESRIWNCVYNEGDIYKAWGAPGSLLVIELAPDELIIKTDAADSHNLDVTSADNLATVKFDGCAIPEPVLVLSQKTTTRTMRHYLFEMSTRPVMCSKNIPVPSAPAGPPVAQAQVAAYDGVQQDGVPQPAAGGPPLTLDVFPNLRHLEHPDDLAAGGEIPYKIQMLYPGDDKAARDLKYAAEARRLQDRQAKQILSDAAAGRGFTTGFLNIHYDGRGDQGLKPCRECGPTDDGNMTRIFFPGGKEVGVLSMLGNVGEGCGDKGEEDFRDLAVEPAERVIDGRTTSGKLMTIHKTAPGWCLRAEGGRVYELLNRSYNAVGYPTGTGTPSPAAERYIKGASR